MARRKAPNMLRRDARDGMGNDARLASLEADNLNTRQDILEIKGTLEGFAGQFNRIEAKISASGTTNWGVMASWAAVVLMIVTIGAGFVGFAFVTRLQADEMVIKEVATKIELVDDRNERYDKEAAIDRMQIRIEGERYARELHDKLVERMNDLEKASTRYDVFLKILHRERNEP